MQNQHNNLQAALDVAAKGYIPVAMLPGQKVPAESWKHWLTEKPTLESIHARWQETPNGIAILCKDCVVFDVDDANELDFVVESTRLHHAPICRTPRGGFHIHGRFRAGVSLPKSTRVNGHLVDLLTGAALSIVPMSVNRNGIPYEWIGNGLPPVADLPIANVDWIQQHPPSPLQPATVCPIVDEESTVRRVRAYLARIAGAVSGQRGHDRTFHVACVLMARFGLTIDQALPLFKEWNDRCEPPWSDKELLHKLQDAQRLFPVFPKGGEP